jgi:phage terminase large subunit GpA-like protein
MHYWYKPSGKRNEALDRRVYAMAALYSRPVPWEVLLRAAPAEPLPRSSSSKGRQSHGALSLVAVASLRSRFECRRIRFRMK